MRIGYLTSQYPATSHTFIRREVAALRRRGVDVLTFSVNQPGAQERDSPVERAELEGTWYVLPPRLDLVRAHARAAGLHPVRYLRALADSLNHRVPGGRALVYAVLYFGEAIYLAEQLRARDVEHLHNHFANPAAIVGFVASRYLDIPWSLTLHGISEFDYPAGLLLQAKLQDAQFVACVADFTRAQAMRTLPPDEWSKLFVNRCGVELAAIDASTAGAADARGEVATGTSAARLRILCVARLSPEKGLSGLLQAFAALHEAGVDAELRIVGDGPDADRLQQEVDALGLGERVSMPGRVAEDAVAVELAHADIFAMGSFMEGLPVVLMEALAQRVPVVAPRVAGIPELVEDGVTGLLFSPSNWDELADALQRLAADPALRQQLGDAGRRRVEQEFDIERAVQPIAAQFGRHAALRRVLPPVRQGLATRGKRLIRDALGAGLSLGRMTGARSRHADKLVVVTFHRVLPEPLRKRYPYPDLAVTPQELDWYLGYFERHYTCGTLAEMQARFAAGERPVRPLLAITFDDGQLDNYSHALPVLQAHGLHASFFIPTGHVERAEPIWHDQLGFAVLGALETTAGQRAFSEVLREHGVAVESAPQPIEAAAVAAKAMSPAARQAFVEAIRDAAGGGEVPAWAGLMTPAHLTALRDRGHELGSHTVNHVLLPQCDGEELAREVRQSRSALEGWLGTEVSSFCYPNGDTSEAVVEAVRAAGYRAAVTTAWQVNDAAGDPLTLGRCDLDGRHVRSALSGELSESLLAYRISGLFPGL